MSNGVIVTVAQIEQFRRDGFVVIDHLLTDDEVEKFGAAVDRAVADRKRGDARALGEKSLYEQSFTQCMNLWEDNPEVLPLTFHPKISETAATLIGVPRLRLWHDQALYKDAGGRYTEPHQDQPYWPMDEIDTLSAWITFDGSTRENGCMAYVPGSHLVGVKKFVNIFTADEKVKILEEPKIAAIAPVYVEVPRGAVAFHHGLTVHLAGANRSTRTRRVHTMIYFRDGATRTKPYAHPSVDRPGIKVGEAIDSELTPIVWPRAIGDWPVPPRMPLTPLFERLNTNGALPNLK
ncbi:MAG TPA: phytanoyl-CoA dioxygenase family protein [Candidatus Binataceae bacterium]|nr:phytanoyl-CoA dioxygenase family protein [Candidatus Binataceae bacterium]